MLNKRVVLAVFCLFAVICICSPSTMGQASATGKDSMCRRSISASRSCRDEKLSTVLTSFAGSSFHVARSQNFP